MQITSGLRSVLSHPVIYTAFQYLMGAKQGWTLFVNTYIRPERGNAILDIGCGPADIVAYLPDIDYWGYDISSEYIERAKLKYGNRGKFHAKILTLEDLEVMPKFDLVIACGVLHHMDDETAEGVFKLAFSALKPNGRFVTIDPCFTPKQNLIARFLISKDRGQNVRAEMGYMALAQSSFTQIKAHVKHDKWIPYTHCIMQAIK